jgi:dTDP-4-dehydrorhamnose reductase
MKILLLGKDGQVGGELQRALAPLGELTSCGRRELDLADQSKLRQHIQALEPDVIVNAAAYTAVDDAESEPEAANLINAAIVATMAEEAARLQCWLVHYSSDYVFDGTKSSPYTEDDTVAPLNAYGQSKALGEKAVTASGCKHLILRSSWVYSAQGSNFPLAILRRARTAEQMTVVADSFGAPTKAALIADATALMLYRIATDRSCAERASGIYHLTASGETSWHGYAQFLIETARQNGIPIAVRSDNILPIAGHEYPTAAQRPQNCRLNNQKLQRTFDLQLPDWRVGVTGLVDELVKQHPLK